MYKSNIINFPKKKPLCCFPTVGANVFTISLYIFPTLWLEYLLGLAQLLFHIWSENLSPLCLCLLDHPILLHIHHNIKNMTPVGFFFYEFNRSLTAYGAPCCLIFIFVKHSSSYSGYIPFVEKAAINSFVPFLVTIVT